MPFTFRRTKRLGKNTRANVSKSGVSVSRKAGPVSVSSRGRGSVKLPGGFSWKFKI